MRKYWHIKFIILLIFLIYWRYIDSFYRYLSYSIAEIFFFVYLIVLAVLFADSVAYRMIKYDIKL